MTVTIIVTCNVCGCNRKVETKGPRKGETYLDWMRRVVPEKVRQTHRRHCLLCKGFPAFEVATIPKEG